MRSLAAELGLQHVDNGVLLGNYLRLPYQRDDHQAHREDTKRQRQTHLGF